MDTEVSASQATMETTETPTTETMTEATSAGPTGESNSESDSDSDSDEPTTGDLCPEGTILCQDGEALTCDGDGGYQEQEVCDGFCLEDIGCVSCEPGVTRCDSDQAEVCAGDGSGYELIEHCDPIQGMTCEDGACQGICTAENLGQSQVGCAFFPTQTAGLRSGNWPFTFGVAVVNGSSETAMIRVENGDTFIYEFAVPAQSIGGVDLPDVPGLDNGSAQAEPSIHVPGGAYRLRSDQPVSVYQYNPNGTNKQGTNSFANDSTILFPAHTFGHSYRVVSRNHWVSGQNHRSGFYSVTASQDQTSVTLTPSNTGGAVLAGGGVASDGTGVVTLDAGDVLAVYTDSSGGFPDMSDLTGTLVSADRPIQVIGGHKCTNVPYDVAACERLEEALVPLHAAGTEHVVAAPLVSTGGEIPKVQMVRITATADSTTLTYSPSVGAQALLAEAGDFIDIGPLNDDFVVRSDQPVIVSQYMIGQNGGNNTGDPAMLVAPPTQQFAQAFDLHASTDFTFNFMTVVAPDGANVMLDGAQLTPFKSIGNSGFSVHRTPLPPNLDGRYRLEGDAEFSASVYGYSENSTYWHSGGQMLKALEP